MNDRTEAFASGLKRLDPVEHVQSQPTTPFSGKLAMFRDFEVHGTATRDGRRRGDVGIRASRKRTRNRSQDPAQLLFDRLLEIL